MFGRRRHVLQDDDEILGIAAQRFNLDDVFVVPLHFPRVGEVQGDLLERGITLNELVFAAQICMAGLSPQEVDGGQAVIQNQSAAARQIFGFLYVFDGTGVPASNGSHTHQG